MFSNIATVFKNKNAEIDVEAFVLNFWFEYNLPYGSLKTLCV